MEEEKRALLALRFTPGIGDYLFKQLVSYCGSARQVFKTPKGRLLKIPGVGSVTAEAIAKEKSFRAADQEIRKAANEKISLIFYSDMAYPSRLRQISDAPALLYCKGKMDLEHVRTVGIVGTREATDYGRECVEALVEQLIPHDALVISGLAYGIDIHAHKQALKNNLQTIGVMGSGIDVMYPQAHADTARRMMAHGGLITENPIGTHPDGHNFPARNRIIAGLSDALIVVEAAASGGALITAELANSYNKDVFAFPGNVGQSHSQGCNNLIKANKAHLITGIKDLEYVMNWTAGKPTPPVARTPDVIVLDEMERQVLQMLKDHDNQLMLDELSWRCNIPVNRLASILLALEFRNIIVSLPGKKYKVKA